MVNCCVKSCKNSSVNTKQCVPRVKYFRPPASNLTIQQEWRAALGIQGQLKELRVCSVHFKDYDFLDSNRLKLRMYAVPGKEIYIYNNIINI